mgnify:CR=1 FL=1
MKQVEVKNVLTPTGEERNFTVEIVPFNRRNDDHVRFAFAYLDMLNKLPSELSSVSDAAQRFVELFVAHKAEDISNPDSVYSCIVKDIRAARTLFNDRELQKSLFDFFENA